MTYTPDEMNTIKLNILNLDKDDAYDYIMGKLDLTLAQLKVLTYFIEDNC